MKNTLGNVNIRLDISEEYVTIAVIQMETYKIFKEGVSKNNLKE